ncbi:MAG: hypothetical protein EBX40_06810, partial [Gammaproteobacteria bacterium]|nr:hypothetical protein [Gammaproteobacteria bacterium]
MKRQIQYRTATPSDLPDLVALQNQNLFSVLTESERREGFLLRALTAEDFNAILDNLSIQIARDNDRLCGYLCGHTFNLRSRFPWLNQIAEHCQTLRYQNKLLMEYPSFLASILCIDREYRKTSLFFRLCNAMLQAVPTEKELVLTFVSVHNLHSLKACLDIDFHPLKKIKIGEHEFWLLVCD